METNKKDNRTDDDKSIFRAAKNNLSQMVVEAKRKLLGQKKETKEAYEMIFSVLSTDKQKLGGENSIFLLPGLLVIAQTHIAEERPKKAEEYLTAAYWNFLKHNKPDDKDDKNKSIIDLTKAEFNQYKTSLHRTFAKLYKLKKDYTEAIKEIQNAVYMDSCSYGPEHPKTTINYYLLGKIFEESSKEQQAEAFYGKVAQIWYRYLKSYLRLSVEEQEMYQFDSLLLQQALEFLKDIELYFAKKYSDGDNNQSLFLPTMRTQYSIGLLYKIFGQNENCRERLKKVFKRCQVFLPENDQNTLGVKSDLQDLGPEYQDMDRPSQNENLGQYSRQQQDYDNLADYQKTPSKPIHSDQGSEGESLQNYSKKEQAELKQEASNEEFDNENQEDVLNQQDLDNHQLGENQNQPNENEQNEQQNENNENQAPQDHQQGQEDQEERAEQQEQAQDTELNAPQQTQDQQNIEAPPQ